MGVVDADSPLWHHIMLRIKACAKFTHYYRCVEKSTVTNIEQATRVALMWHVWHECRS
jgi:hypothetical protein